MKPSLLWVSITLAAVLHLICGSGAVEAEPSASTGRTEPTDSQPVVADYLSDSVNVSDETAPLTLTISANQYTISDTQPILITISLTNNLDTPIRIHRTPLEDPEFHVTDPAGSTFKLITLYNHVVFPTIAYYPLLQPRQSYATGCNLRRFSVILDGGWYPALFDDTGTYKIHTTFSQPARASLMGSTPETPTFIDLIPVELTSNEIELVRP